MKTAFYTSAHPNAGLPNAFGEYDETPEEMTAFIEAYFNDNLINVIGGCCGTNPAHIKAIYEASSKSQTTSIKTHLEMESDCQKYLTLSGLEPLVVTPESNFCKRW